VDRSLEVIGGGHHDHGDIGVVGHHLLEDLLAGEMGHAEIEQQHAHLLFCQ
jgi:hypothetical protein